MAPKKAAKKVAKKAAKKSAPKGKDMLRCYEHLGRVQFLVAQMDGEQVVSVRLLAAHAEDRLHAGEMKDAAELLRAAEHLGFGSMALAAEADEVLSVGLLESVQEQFALLRERAVEHGEAQDAPRSVLALYRRMMKQGVTALRSGRYRAALELVRGAEALAHVGSFGDLRLAAGRKSAALERSFA